MTNLLAKKHQEAFTSSLLEIKLPQEYEIEGIKVIVNPNVFPPATDTKLFARNINVRSRSSVLELTTGSGILSIIAAKQGAIVTAVDINPEAVENAEQNFSKNKVEIDVRISDLFSNVPLQKFDYILVNGPYFDGEVTKPLEYASLGVKDFTKRIFSNLHDYLNKEGKLLITFAEFGEIDYFHQSIEDCHLLSKLIDFQFSNDGKRKYNLYSLETQ